MRIENWQAEEERSVPSELSISFALRSNALQMHLKNESRVWKIF